MTRKKGKKGFMTPKKAKKNSMTPKKDKKKFMTPKKRRKKIHDPQKSGKKFLTQKSCIFILGVFSPKYQFMWKMLNKNPQYIVLLVNFNQKPRSHDELFLRYGRILKKRHIHFLPFPSFWPLYIEYWWKASTDTPKKRVFSCK